MSVYSLWLDGTMSHLTPLPSHLLVVSSPAPRRTHALTNRSQLHIIALHLDVLVEKAPPCTSAVQIWTKLYGKKWDRMCLAPAGRGSEVKGRWEEAEAEVYRPCRVPVPQRCEMEMRRNRQSSA